jgi:hypothetical protein
MRRLADQAEAPPVAADRKSATEPERGWSPGERRRATSEGGPK